jgi:hypothetical protein
MGAAGLLLAAAGLLGGCWAAAGRLQLLAGRPASPAGPPGSPRRDPSAPAAACAQVTAEVPTWAGFIPLSSIEGVGRGVMQKTLDLMVPRFLQQLEKDYGTWAAGDLSRKPAEQ